MNLIIRRRENDLKKLRELEKKYDFIKIIDVSGNPISEIKIKLNLGLPVNKEQKGGPFELFIKLPADYPLKSPMFSIKPVVFNPHVFESGNICTGYKWMPSNTLDLEVIRIIKLLLLYPEYINSKSPANSQALSWFKKNKKKFPLLKLEEIYKENKSKIQWKEFQ
ncbi:MAG: hypothetical protein KatS3mg129_0907 [Leptospiraceae bacterium]|nr:MAG: hypothetical protein KatS3mg129_0907 [Leptospiraceae bacterium]